MVTAKPAEQIKAEKKNELERLRIEIENKTGKSVTQLFKAREDRVRAAIELREADRVPLSFWLGMFSASSAGLPLSAVYYDAAGWRKGVINFALEYGPDIHRVNIAGDAGLGLESLDAKRVRWPGGTLPPDVMNQVMEEEYMKEDEYDLFLSDPTDFMLRCYLPRVFGALRPLAKIPTMGERLTGFLSMSPMFTKPEFREVAQSVLEAGREQEQWHQIVGNIVDELGSLGFPAQDYPGGVAGPPWDVICNNFRGMRGIMTDMFRRPEKLLAACEKILEWRLVRATPANPKQSYPKRVAGGAIHRGGDNYLSKKQFETFYWPTYKRSLMATIEMGFIPVPNCQGRCDDRLEYFLELPKGKVLLRFEQTDMARAKAILGNHTCIMGNVPPILLQTGSPQEVTEYCQNLIKVCGKGGGFILSNAAALDQTAKPANVKAMVDSVQKYGWY